MRYFLCGGSTCKTDGKQRCGNLYGGKPFLCTSFSATSEKARSLGNSINYSEMDAMYTVLAGKKVYINKNMDERYPLMANAIYSEDEMQLILMIWGIPWERMTLGQANMLTVIGYLIQNAVVRANRYISALEQQRYIKGTNILEPEAFLALVKAYLNARDKGLTQCALLSVDTKENDRDEVGKRLIKLLRQSDYVGELEGGKMYALLANTSAKDATMVKERFEKRVCPARYRRMYLYDGCRKEILYRSSDQYGCCCFICDRKQQDQAERKKIQIF